MSDIQNIVKNIQNIMRVYPLDTELSNGAKKPKLTVLTWDEKREVQKDGNIIQFMPLWEWLLEINL